MLVPSDLEGRARQKWLWYRQMNASERGTWVWKLRIAGDYRHQLARLGHPVPPHCEPRASHARLMAEVRALPPAPLPR